MAGSLGAKGTMGSMGSMGSMGTMGTKMIDETTGIERDQWDQEEHRDHGD